MLQILQETLDRKLTLEEKSLATLCGGHSKVHYKKLFTYVESHASAVSLLERVVLYKSEQQQHWKSNTCQNCTWLFSLTFYQLNYVEWRKSHETRRIPCILRIMCMFLKTAAPAD